MQSFQSMSVWNPAPSILLKSEPDSSPEKREFTRQLVPSCLLKLVNLLDHISVQELRFLPELCIGREESAADQAITMPVTTAAPTRSRFSALVVDDSSTVRAQVGLGLKIFGAAADFAESAEEAFELLGKNSYDIAFLDVVLPGADGYQVCKTIKKNPKHRDTVVIMLTSKSSTFDRVKASLAGCDTFLTKPVQNEQFQQVLGKYLAVSSDAVSQALWSK
jgi:twitching motility two-component system response regulator PilG